MGDHYYPGRTQVRIGDTELDPQTIQRIGAEFAAAAGAGVELRGVPQPHRVVLISGKQGSGKSTLADGLARLAAAAGMAVYRTRFARVIYEIHDEARRVARKYGVAWPDKYGRFLQLLGTELGREQFGDDVWVDACRADVEQHLAGATRPTLVLIDDMRFPNEFRAFAPTSWPVTRVRLVASESARRVRAAGWREATGHASETSLDALEADGAFDVTLRTDVSVAGADETLAHVAGMLGLGALPDALRVETRLSNGMVAKQAVDPAQTIGFEVPGDVAPLRRLVGSGHYRRRDGGVSCLRARRGSRDFTSTDSRWSGGLVVVSGGSADLFFEGALALVKRGWDAELASPADLMEFIRPLNDQEFLNGDQQQTLSGTAIQR